MKTFIFFLVTIILILFLQQCNINDPITSPERTISRDSIQRDLILLCCNVTHPNCPIDGNMSLKTICGGNEIESVISCECCEAIWQYYDGNLPEYLPCNIINLAGCQETKQKMEE